MLRHIRIEDLLREVDVRCGLTREFRPLPGYEARLHPLIPVLQAAITAHATNLGIVAMSNSTDGISVEALREATHWFLRESTLKAANTRLINYHHTYTMSGVWGS
ncbi:MAG: Tn3 family transposase, partial [Acidobacteriaceae bacterium]|nr:Tn3 family transposase [Acidobacteriaceae bacterium]